MKTKTYISLLFFSALMSYSVLQVSANEPYIPAFPMIVGEEQFGTSNQINQPTFEGDTPGRDNNQKQDPAIVPKILTSSDIGKSVNTGYGIFEKLRVEGLRRLEN